MQTFLKVKSKQNKMVKRYLSINTHTHIYIRMNVYDVKYHVYDIKYYRTEQNILIILIDLMTKLNLTLSYIHEKLINKEIQ